MFRQQNWMDFKTLNSKQVEKGKQNWLYPVINELIERENQQSRAGKLHLLISVNEPFDTTFNSWIKHT